MVVSRKVEIVETERMRRRGVSVLSGIWEAVLRARFRAGRLSAVT
jgi:hypothetical protein